MATGIEDALSEQTLSGLLRRAAQLWPQQRALIDERRVWTWSELDAEVDQVACLFEACGIQPGDPIGFLLVKRAEVVIGFLACARMGAVQVPVNFKLHPDQVSDQFTTAGIRAVLTEPQHDALLRHLLPLHRSSRVGRSNPLPLHCASMPPAKPLPLFGACRQQQQQLQQQPPPPQQQQLLQQQQPQPPPPQHCSSCVSTQWQRSGIFFKGEGDLAFFKGEGRILVVS